MFSGSYSAQIPGGDLGKRFGINSAIGTKFSIKTKSNYIFGTEYQFLFGDSIKENDILNNLATSSGMIINNSGQEAEIYFYERGFRINNTVGKLWSTKKGNPNSGIFFLAGIGLLQHKIRIDDIHRDVPGLSKEYKKGYDRLTNGISFSQTIGYMHFSNNRRINFYVGLEFTQAVTQNRRSYNYDEMQRDNSNRLDLLNGIKFGWIIPIYKKTPQEFYFY